MDLFEITEILGANWAKIIAGFTLVYLIWRYIGRSLIAIGRKVASVQEGVSSSLPVLLEISRNFNGKNSLHEIISEMRLEQIRSHNRIRAIVNHLGLCFFETDGAGLTTYVSKEYTEITNLDQISAEGNGWLNSIDESDRAKVSKEWEDAVKQRRESSIEYKIGGKSVKSHAFPIKHGDSVIGFVGFIVSVK